MPWCNSIKTNFPMSSRKRCKKVAGVFLGLLRWDLLEIYEGLIDYLAKRESDDQICSHAKTLNHVAIG